MVNSSFQLSGSTMLVDATSSPFESLQDHFDVGTFLKGRDLDVDAQTMPIGIGLGRKSADPCFFGNSAGEVIFWQEKVHLGIITIKEVDHLCRG